MNYLVKILQFIPFIGPAFITSTDFGARLQWTLYHLAVFLISMNVITYYLMK